MLFARPSNKSISLYSVLNVEWTCEILQDSEFRESGISVDTIFCLKWLRQTRCHFEVPVGHANSSKSSCAWKSFPATWPHSPSLSVRFNREIAHVEFALVHISCWDWAPSCGCTRHICVIPVACWANRCALSKTVAVLFLSEKWSLWHNFCISRCTSVTCECKCGDSNPFNYTG